MFSRIHSNQRNGFLMKSGARRVFALSLTVLTANAGAVSSVALPSWVCAKPDAIFIHGFESAIAVPHNPSQGSGGSYPGSLSRSITVTGYASEAYFLHVPPSYRPARAMPLLVVLHGAAGTHTDAITAASDLRDDWASVADTNGFIVIAPVGENSNGAWNAPPGTPTDYDLIAAAFTDAATAYNIERSRRYLWGFSAGGYVSYDVVLNGLNSNINAGVLAAYSANSADMGFACVLYSGDCDQLLNAQARKVPVDIHVGIQDIQNPSHLAAAQADHTRLLAHGWTDASTVFYTEFNDGHTYFGQLPGAWHSLCGFALTP